MNTDFYLKIEKSTAHRPIRHELSNMVFNNSNLLPELMATALNTSDKNHHKACWISELVFENKIEWLKEYLDVFCNNLSNFTSDSAIRSISKICLFAIQEHQKSESGFLNGKHISQITESCFDWLINPVGKVANKAYAMRTLFLIGKKEDWIYPELEHILPQGFPLHTAAYKAAAKDILKQIEKAKKR
ncbi:hypothetical protein Q763_00205 [Flavobacterium beibuense F44-8]|uniref:Adenylosuccinate lyase n=1 Tax=Flavobacterium beibuense F44-8 TaxID=1406840 RepID=A0A0A2LYD9_9FLAO|nr:hypothetical protein [Flavobacterium beibuense]KGO84203.1 hypothetical protein Q763_00205 [Flavobacterium beibuense F44-8]